MNRNYFDQKDTISKFKKVLVTGPHGAGNKITATIISHDFQLPYIRGEQTWKSWEYKDPEPRGLFSFHERLKNDSWVIFGPSQSSHLHNITQYLQDVLVVFTFKNIDEIKDYSTRNRFVRNITHMYEWEAHRTMIDKDFPELSFLKNWEIEEMTYFLWEVKQRDLLPNWIEVQHSSLEGHELWVPKKDRRHFTEWMVRDGQQPHELPGIVKPS